MMANVVKLQMIGNSIRATIPKEIVDDLSLKKGEDMIVTTIDDSIVLKREKHTSGKPSKFYGSLKKKTGEVTHWPTPKEIKAIWE